MIVVEKSTNPNDNNVIVIGRQCETGVTQIQFDLSYLIETYGNGSAVIVHQRSQDVAPYIVSDYERGDGIVTWTIDDVDTLFDGCGHCELRWTVNDALAKTVVYKTITIKSITGDTEIPTALQSWYDAMIEYIDTHSVDPEDIYEAVEAYMEQHPISGAVISVNNKTGEVTLTASDVGALPDSTPIPGKTSDLVNDSGFIAQETDPTVPSWAKQQNKPTYTAQEVGALPSDTTIPTKVSQLQNDSGFGTYSKPSGGIPSSDMTSSVQTTLGKADSAYQKPSGGIPSTDMSSAVQSSLGKADTALQSAPVTSVNTKTGTVVLDAGDLEYDDTETYSSGTVGDELSELKSQISQMSGLSEDVKTALLQIASKVAYIDDDGQDYYDDLYDALYPTSDLVSISAIYTQSGTVYDTDSLDSLMDDLVVTALYEDQTTKTVTAYTLSGSLVEGTSTITVTYNGKTTTFDVVVTLSRATRFGDFTAGYACGKAVSHTTDVADNGVWNVRTNYRAAMTQPILNRGYTITVTDSSAYSVAVYDIINNTPIPTSYANAIGGIYYQGGTKSISWLTSDSATSEYIMIALKKNNNTAFTTAELANGAEAVFTFTET